MLLMPGFAFAADNSINETDVADFILKAQDIDGGVLSETAPYEGNLEISSLSDSARFSSSAFALEKFSRAQKGSNRPIAGIYQGYLYLAGSIPTPLIMLASKDIAVVYISPDIAALIDNYNDMDTSLSEVPSEKTQSLLKAYLIALDAANANGTDSVSQDTLWVFTTASSLNINGVTYKFNQEYQDGYFYTGVQGVNGTDITQDTTLQEFIPTHADFAFINTSDKVVVTQASQGFAALGEFLHTLDWSPLWVTLKTTGTAIIVVFFLGLLFAWWSLRISPRAQDIVDSILTIPMVLPPTVCGFLLLLLLGKNTAFGQWFIDVGFPLAFSWPATVLAAVVVSFPLMYRSARGAFESIDSNMLNAARTLGWGEGKIFYRLMMPLAWSSIAAGTVLAFARALGEFGATLFLAGNYVGVTRTIPIAIYFEWMNGNTDVALFWTGIIIAFSFLVILFINLWSRHTTKYRQKENKSA